MKFTVKDILDMEVTLALGCTEPVAIALGAAAAASLLPEKEFDTIEIWIDPNIYKNGMAVTIPGSGDMQGLDTAAALGAYGGDPDRGLEVLASLDDDTIKKASQLLKANSVTVHLREEKGLYVQTKITAGENIAESLIVDLHSNIISLKLNGKEVQDSPLLSKAGKKDGKHPLAELETWLRELTLPEILELTADLDEEDLNFLEEGVTHNLALAEHGLKYGTGLGIGKAIDREVEGQHAIIGSKLAKKFGETPEVVHAIAAHHEDVPPSSVYDLLIQAADALSGARPGARKELLENYIKRLEDLENIAKSFNGVANTYAIQAGRELRVIVESGIISDEESTLLSRDIAKKIEESLTFPGQIRVTVIRETRAVEYANK